MEHSAGVFPGQGSQKPGMGAEWAASAPGHDLFQRADDILGFPLSRLCLEGPEEVLTRTENAQPALFVTSMIAWELLREAGFRAKALAGHSLGEYSALAAAGVFRFEDGLRVVRRRGELMAEVGDRVSGAMAAVLGLTADEVAAACRDAGSAGRVEVANLNSPEQTVISGESGAVERAMELARERGARRCLKLNVAAPFHSSLMAPLAEAMRGVLAEAHLSPPSIPVLANVTAAPVTSPEEVRDLLVRQVAGTVRWTETIQRLAAEGVTETVEVGVGRVLTGLTPRCDPGLTALSTEEALQRLR